MSTWMVVEDEPDIYDVLLAMFEIWGIEGVAFVDGAEAVAWIDDVDAGRVRGDLPELAILDIRLPEVSGPDVGARLRRSPVLGDIAIVLITAYRLTPEEEEAVTAQAQADLLKYKPLPAMMELRQTMDQVIAVRKRIKAARETSEAQAAKLKDADAPGAGSAASAGTPAPGPAANQETAAESSPPAVKPESKNSANGKSAHPSNS